MTLILQIKILLLSFIYGIFFKFTFNISKKILLHNNKLFKTIINLLFMIDHALIFFIIIRKINNSILHIYCFPIFILGIILFDKYFTSNNLKN